MRSADDQLREMLIKHEGLRLKPYKCPAGKITIGCGRNLEDIGISEMEARLMLTNDIERVNEEAIANFAWFKSLNGPRQNVVLSMIFNMGLPAFKQFKKTIQYIVNGDYERAAAEMLLSKWHQQVGIRARELAAIMKTGRY